MTDIDASIPLRATTDYGSPLDTAAKAMTLKHLMAQDQLQPLQMQSAQLGLKGQQMQLDESQKAIQDADAIKGVFQSAVDSKTGKLDKQKALSGLYTIDPIKAATIGTQWAKSDADFAKTMQESHKSFIGLAAPAAQGIVNEFDKQVKSGVPAEVAEENLRPRIATSMQMLDQAGYGPEFHGGDPTKITMDKLRAIAGQSSKNMEAQATAEQRGTANAMELRRTVASERRATAAEAGSSKGKVPVGYRQLPNGNLEAIPGGPGAPEASISEDVADLHGDDYLKTLPPGERESIKGVANGDVPLTSFSMRGGHRERIFAQAKQFDPDYTANRFNVQKDFTTGKAANNVTAINTALGHIGSMVDLGEALKNKDTKIANRIINRISTETGNPDVNNFDLARNAVGDELMRVFRQVGASDAEAESWKRRLDSSNSPEQMAGVAKTAAELLESRIGALNDQYKRGTGRQSGFPHLLSKHSQEVMGRVSGHQYDEEGNRIIAGTTIDNDHPADVNDLLNKYNNAQP